MIEEGLTLAPAPVVGAGYIRPLQNAAGRG